MTFESLKTDFNNYMERGFTEASDPIVFDQIPRLINLAERRCARELKIQGFQATLTSTMATGVAVIAKPDRWRETISMNFGTGTLNNTRNFLKPRSYEYCVAYWPDRTATDVPEFYADYNYSNWFISPTPAAAYPFEVLLWELPALLDDDNQENWTTEYIPELLLYATLLEATPFLKNDERITIWTQMYDRAAAAINGEDLAKILDRTSERKTA